MWVGTLELDLLLGGSELPVRSLKEKRSVVRPIVAELQRRFAVAAAEAGSLELHARSLIGVAVVAADRGHCVAVLDGCERLVAQRPEVQVLSARQRLLRGDDLDANHMVVRDTDDMVVEDERKGEHDG
jgi:uncharacterized protein YlxP (DUF503 family)